MPPNEGTRLDRLYNKIAGCKTGYPIDEWDDGFNAGVEAAMRAVDRARMEQHDDA